MKKIGYIYRYNREEKKGILVYGYNNFINTIKYYPIKFSVSDCISPVQTGQLVYFELVDNSTASQIERASLLNFKRNIIEDLVSCYDTKEWNEGYKYTIIRYENLNDSISLEPRRKCRRLLCNFAYDELPQSIDELFALFGTKIHFEGYDEGESVDVLDMAYWIDKDIINLRSFYGSTVEQALDLFNLFVGKKRNAYNNFSSYGYDNSISSGWKHLLSTFSSEDLFEIYKKEPILQPVMPDDFCMENLNSLSADYGFPSNEVCDAFYRLKINEVISTKDYLYFEDKLNSRNNASYDRRHSKGVQIYDMDKEIIHELYNLLKVQYNNVVLNNLCKKLSRISGERINLEKRISLLNNETTDYLLNLGLAFDEYNGILNEGTIHIWDFLKYYKLLLEEDKMFFKTPIGNWCKEYLIHIANLKDYPCKASEIGSVMRSLSDFLTVSFIKEIRDMVNQEFAELDDFEELKSAYEDNLISEEQYLKRYEILTNDFTIQQLCNEITSCRCFSYTIPLSLQNYLLRRIFAIIDYKGWDTIKAISIKNESIYNLIGLIKWLKKQPNLDPILIKNIIDEMSIHLSEEDKIIFGNDSYTSTLDDSYLNRVDADDEDNGYSHYKGTYAQDEAGYSDDDIDTIFDGDPNAYWNID